MQLIYIIFNLTICNTYLHFLFTNYFVIILIDLRNNNVRLLPLKLKKNYINYRKRITIATMVDRYEIFNMLYSEF